MIDTLAVAADGVVYESEGQVEPHRQQNSDPVNNRLEFLTSSSNVNQFETFI